MRPFTREETSAKADLLQSSILPYVQKYEKKDGKKQADG